MNPKTCAHAFDTFYSTIPNRETGIGLTIVKQVVEMRGGQVSVESRPGEETVIILTLPIS
ncbi:MAG: HAMP domain-containing histidine kinase [candidate division Zixibacteria bacterium]|nr:HAMP domain-containing histidine kinase [candidate division Zixibacteria bacterium]